MTSILVFEGCQVICAEAGEQARVENSRCGINLVFLGVVMWAKPGSLSVEFGKPV
jgi:hypothetical protein